MSTPSSSKKLLYLTIVALFTVLGLRSGFSQVADLKTWKTGDLLTADDLNASFAAQAGAAVPYAWSNFAPVIQGEGVIQPDGHVAQMRFASPLAGYALVTANYEVRFRNTFDSTKINCRVESLLGLTTGMSTCPAAQSCALTGYAQNTFNANLPTQLEDGAWLGVTQVASRIFPVKKGDNVIYLNGRTDCAGAYWGALTMTALFVREAPQASVSIP